MGIPAGPWYVDDTPTFTANTHDVATGAGTDADSVPSYRVYEDETGTAILTGSMAKLDDSNTVGFYSEQITLSAANGFEVGKSYSIYVTATVGSVAATQSFNFKVITNPQTLLAAIDSKTTNLPSDPADASVIAGRLDAIDTNLAAVDTVVDAILVDTAEIGAAGAGLTSVPWNAAWDAEVQSEATDALNAYDPPTKAELDAAVAPLATAAALATVDTEIGVIDGIVDDILTDTGTTLPATLATIAGYIDTEIGTIITAVADLPTNAELATALGTAGLATAAALATVDGNVDTMMARLGELWALEGLDISNPMTVTPTSRVSGTLAQTISGDGTTTTTVTRDP